MSVLHESGFVASNLFEIDVAQFISQLENPLIKELSFDEYADMMSAVRENNVTYSEYNYSLHPQSNDIEFIQLYCNSSSALNSNDAVQLFFAGGLNVATMLTLQPSDSCKSLAIWFDTNSTSKIGSIIGNGQLDNLYMFNSHGFDFTNSIIGNVKNVFAAANKLPAHFSNLTEARASDFAPYLNSQNSTSEIHFSNLQSLCEFSSFASKVDLQGSGYVNKYNVDCKKLSFTNSTFMFDTGSLKFEKLDFQNSTVSSQQVELGLKTAYNISEIADFIHHALKTNQVTLNFLSNANQVNVGNVTLNSGVVVNANATVNIDNKMNTTSLEINTPRDANVNGYLTTGELEIKANNTVFDFGSRVIANNATFLLSPNNGTLSLKMGAEFFTEGLKLSNGTTVVVKSATLVAKETSGYNFTVIAKPNSFSIAKTLIPSPVKVEPTPTPGGGGGMKSVFTKTIATPSYQDTCSETGKNYFDPTKQRNEVCYSDKVAQLYVVGFKESWQGDPSSYVDLGTVEGFVKLIEITASYFKANLALTQNEEHLTKVVNNLIVIYKILEARFLHPGGDEASCKKNGNYAKLLQKAWSAVHELSSVEIPLAVGDGVHKEPYMHLPSKLIISGNFSEIIQSPNGEAVDNVAKLIQALQTLSKISNGNIKPEDKVIEFNNAMQKFGNSPTLNPKRPIQTEDQKRTSVSQNHLENVYRYDANDPDYVYLQKVFKGYECDMSVGDLKKRLNPETNIVEKIICQEDCTTSMIEDALFRATGAKNLEDLIHALKLYFEDNNANYFQKKCFQIEALVEQAVKYANKYDFI